MVDRTAWSLQTIKKFSTKAHLLAVNSAHNAHLVQQAFEENVWRSILCLRNILSDTLTYLDIRSLWHRSAGGLVRDGEERDDAEGDSAGD